MRELLLVFGVAEITTIEILFRKYVKSTYILYEIMLASQQLQTW
jgi:hypothetical protein